MSMDLQAKVARKRKQNYLSHTSRQKISQPDSLGVQKPNCLALKRYAKNYDATYKYMQQTTILSKDINEARLWTSAKLKHTRG